MITMESFKRLLKGLGPFPQGGHEDRIRKVEEKLDAMTRLKEVSNMGRENWARSLKAKLDYEVAKYDVDGQVEDFLTSKSQPNVMVSMVSMGMPICIDLTESRDVMKSRLRYALVRLAEKVQRNIEKLGGGK